MINEKGKITDLTITSRELGEDVEMLIYLPPAFSPLNKYTVLIAQDGRDYFQLGRIGKIAGELIKKGDIENLIIVGIPYKNVEDRRNKYHPKGELHHAYIRFLAHELVPYLDQQFPTYQIGMGRALIGDSLGATVSLLTALQYPHTFGKVIMQSPYIDNHIMNAVENFSEPHLISLYHVIGKQEFAVKTTDQQVKDFLTPNRRLSELIQKKRFSYFYDEFSGDHTWKYWQPDLNRALLKMFK